MVNGVATLDGVADVAILVVSTPLALVPDFVAVAALGGSTCLVEADKVAFAASTLVTSIP
jgi:hypothetical protein